MSRTITAMFNSRSDAEAARARLEAAGLGVQDVKVLDQGSEGYAAETTSTAESKGIWGSIKDLFMPEGDRHTYEEGIRRGHAVLVAQVDNDRADEVAHLLHDADSVDFDERTSQWQQSGWAAPAGVAATGTAAAALGDERLMTRSDDRMMDRAAGSEEVVPVVEEQLVVGKRAVERGGVRVRSYVVETPVEERVNLRDEHVTVERRRVDLPLRDADELFREREIEMVETGERAVVGKSARVVEEIVVRKQVGDRVETVGDTVRRTQVDVEDLGDREREITAGDRALVDGDRRL